MAAAGALGVSVCVWNYGGTNGRSVHYYPYQMVNAPVGNKFNLYMSEEVHERA